MPKKITLYSRDPYRLYTSDGIYIRGEEYGIASIEPDPRDGAAWVNIEHHLQSQYDDRPPCNPKCTCEICRAVVIPEV